MTVRMDAFFAMALAAVLVEANPAPSAEIEGRVTVVEGRTLKITTTSELLPAVGDPVRIVVFIPGLDDVAEVGRGRVVRLEGAVIVASIENAPGRLAVGQTARITSVKPGSGTSARPHSANAALSPATPFTSPLRGLSDQDETIVKSVTALLSRSHLSGHPVDDMISRRMLDNLLRELDGQKLFLTKADVDRLRRNQDQLDNELRSGRLDSVYELANLFLRRVRERMPLAMEWIYVDHDFSVEETWITDVKKRDYAADDPSIRETWRKYVKYELLAHLLTGENLDEARNKTRKQLEDFRERRQKLSDTELVEMSLNALVRAYDPHSQYISPKMYEDFVIAQRKQLVGIGAAVRLADGHVEVAQIVAGAPADRDGRLAAGDRIVAVGQGHDPQWTDLAGMGVRQVVETIRGEAGTVVRLKVLPAGRFETQVYELTRDKVHAAALQHAIVPSEALPGDRSAAVGYLSLPSIYGDIHAEGSEQIHSASEDVRLALRAFREKSVDVVVLDLRRNGGGSLLETQRLAALFLGQVPLLQEKDSQGQVRRQDCTASPVAWDGPLVVLTTSATSGGCEILAAALQDYGRALIVGDEHTHGYGTIQSVLDIGRQLFKVDNPPRLGFLKVTNGRFYRLTGESTQATGVAVDIPLPSLLTHMGIREKDSRYALQTDRIPPVAFERQTRGPNDDWIAELNRRSRVRRETSPYFRGLAKRIEQYQARRARGAMSLNLEHLIAERKSSTSGETAPSLPGIREVRMDGYFRETMAVTLDYFRLMSSAPLEPVP